MFKVGDLVRSKVFKEFVYEVLGPHEIMGDAIRIRLITPPYTNGWNPVRCMEHVIYGPPTELETLLRSECLK